MTDDKSSSMSRVLFVDDEPYVLEGLRLSLRRKRSVWKMTFVETAAAALAEIEREAPHLVVTDMRMPGMDGAELLRRVAELAPQTTRIVLSGQMEEDAAARAVKVAHRFMTKPCDSAALEAVITRVLELHGWLDSALLRDKLGGLETLPSLPRVRRELCDALNAPDCSLKTVTQLIQRDSAMSAKVLQLINSSFFGMPRNIVSVAQAVSYLGLQTMKSLVLSHEVFPEPTTADIAMVERQQAHALLSSSIARRLFDDPAKAERAETAALLHDIGLLALADRLPNEHAQHLAKARSCGAPLHVVERAQLSVTHAEVGAYLLGLWGLPRDIVDAVAAHHAPWSTLTTLDTSAAVRIADALARSARPVENEELDSDTELPAEVVERLGLQTIVAELRQQLANGALA